MDRSGAVDRLEQLVDTVESDPMPVPIKELWVLGDLALGLDPVERLDVYVRKELLFGRDDDAAARFKDSHGIEGVGRTVDADWASAFPEHLRATDAGHAAPEQCLAAHLVDRGEPIHLEVCNTGFEANVTQRLEGALARDDYGQILDPRGVCLWIDGHRDEEAFDKLRQGEYVFPTLSEALEMLGLEESAAQRAAEAVRECRTSREGTTVRGEVI
ncbi:MAG: hypothetical protein ABEH64_11830 [Salinirussus sp.]